MNILSFLFVHQKLLRDFKGVIPTPPELIIKSVEIRKIGGVGAGNGADFQMQLSRNRTQVFDCDFGTGKNCLVRQKEGRGEVEGV